MSLFPPFFLMLSVWQCFCVGHVCLFVESQPFLMSRVTHLVIYNTASFVSKTMKHLKYSPLFLFQGPVYALENTLNWKRWPSLTSMFLRLRPVYYLVKHPRRSTCHFPVCHSHHAPLCCMSNRPLWSWAQKPLIRHVEPEFLLLWLRSMKPPDRRRRRSKCRAGRWRWHSTASAFLEAAITSDGCLQENMDQLLPPLPLDVHNQ